MYYNIEYIEKGKVKEIVIFAKNEIEALKKFKKSKKGIIKSITVIEKKPILKEFLEKIDFLGIDLEEFIAVLDQMYVMLDAGMSIDVVMENVILGMKDKRLKNIFIGIHSDIKAGLSLTEAFSRYEKKVGNIVIAMIRLGEETGDLSRAVKDLTVILTEILDNRKRLKKATRYPMFILFAMAIAFVIVILFVIPPFKSVFAQLGTQLPLPTRFLLWTEAALTHYGVYVLSGAVVTFIVIGYFYATSYKVRFFLDRLMLKIYIVGNVIKLAMIGRFVYVLQRLVDAGIPIFDAVDIALNIVDNVYIKEKLSAIKTSIQTGGSIAGGFKEAGMFEIMTVQMIQAGEDSGALVHMLQKVSKYYLDKYRFIVDNISTLIEPLLIAAIAGFVMTLALGIFLPMWSLTQITK